MRIAHVIHDLNSELGGIGTAPLGMATSLAQTGIDVEVWTSNSQGWKAPRLITQPGSLGLFEYPGPPGPFDRSFSRHFERALERIDLLHHHDFWRPHSARLVAACARLGKPAVLTAHGVFMKWSMSQKSLKKRAYLALVGARQLRRASAVQMLGRIETRQSRHVGINFRYFELPNGVSRSEFQNLPPRGSFRSRERGLEDKLLILSLGRLHHSKGADLLLRAFLDLASEFPDIALVMAGPDGGLRASLEEMLRGHPHSSRVRLPGLVHGGLRLALLTDADVFAQCSVQETASMSIIEAAMAAKPMLVTDRCSHPEIDEVGAGLVVDYSMRAVREGLRRLIVERDQLRRYGDNARRLAERCFALDLLTPRLIEHYQRLIAGEEYPWLLGGE